MPTSAIEVDHPAEVAFGYVTDPARFGEWQRGVVSGHVEGDGRPVVGDRCTMSRRVGFFERNVTSTVTHVDPPLRWGVRGIDGPVRAVVDVEVEPLEDGRRSKVIIDVDFEGHGIGKLLVPLVVRRQARREMPANLDRLRRRLDDIDRDARGEH